MTNEGTQYWKERKIVRQDKKACQFCFDRMFKRGKQILNSCHKFIKIKITYLHERLFVTLKNTSQIRTICIQKTVIKWSQLFAKTRMNILGVFIFANSAVGLAKLRAPKTSSTPTILTCRWVLKYTGNFRK